MRPIEGYSPLETAEEGICRGKGKSDLARGADELGCAERGTCQEREREQKNKGHSPSRDRRRRDTSGYRKESA